MGWTNPKTWGVAEAVDDVTMNLHIRDNLVYLKAIADGLESDKVDRAGDTMTGRLVAPGIDLSDLDFDDMASPGVSAADHSRIYMDQTAEKLKVSQDGGAYHNLVLQTVKGDLVTFSTVPIRLAVGTQGYILQADSGQAAGMKWTPAIDTHGILLYDAVTFVKAALYLHSEFRRTGTITAAYARRTGGTGATVNIRRGGSNIRSANLSLTTTGWTGFGALQNTAFVPGHDLDFYVVTVAGSVTQLAMYIVFQLSD